MAMPMSVNSLMSGLTGGGAPAQQTPPMPGAMAQGIAPQMPMAPAPQMPIPGLPPQGAQPNMPTSGIQSMLAAGKSVPSLESLLFGGVSKNG